MADTDTLLSMIERRLVEIGMTPATASRLAVGHPYLIYSLRKKRFDPKYQTLTKLCDVLGLEMYIGPPRDKVPPPPSPSVHQDEVQADSRSLVQISNIDNLQSQLSEMSACLTKTQTTVAALASAVIEDEPNNAHPLSVVEVEAAAGGGAAVDWEEVTGHVWFRRDWLDKHSIDPKRSVIMKVTGESMEPILMDGASILVDRARTRRRAGHIYVIRTDDGLVAKRLGRNRKGVWQLESVHCEHTPVAWDRFMEVIGEIRWTARTLPTQRGI